MLAMASSLPFLLLVVVLTTLGVNSAMAMATTSRPAGRRPLFRKYIGAEGTNLTLADVPVHPGVDFDFILAFAIDYAVDTAPNSTAPPTAASPCFGTRPSSPRPPSPPPSSAATATARAESAWRFASIAPFANPNVQAHYGELWWRYGSEFDVVNFHFYAYDANTTMEQFLGYYDEQSVRYAGAGEGGEKGKVDRVLRRQGRLHGVFVWAADNSVADGFRYERRAQRFLAGDAPGFTA
ncbi:hypothetical protein EJB05_50290, partial [Eragrostis curvula]